MAEGREGPSRSSAILPCNSSVSRLVHACMYLTVVQADRGETHATGALAGIDNDSHISKACHLADIPESVPGEDGTALSRSQGGGPKAMSSCPT